MHRKIPISLAAAVLALSAQHLRAEQSADPESYDVAMQLANPVASLISLPLQNNFDWGAGPTAVALRQSNGWTVGMLANHIWSYAGEDSRQDVSATLLQPFLTYTTGTHTTFSLNTESSYDWENSQWNVPINLGVAQLVKIGGSLVQFQLGGRYYAETPDNGPDWGLRFTVTFLWPR